MIGCQLPQILLLLGIRKEKLANTGRSYCRYYCRTIYRLGNLKIQSKIYTVLVKNIYSLHGAVSSHILCKTIAISSLINEFSCNFPFPEKLQVFLIFWVVFCVSIFLNFWLFAAAVLERIFLLVIQSHPLSSRIIPTEVNRTRPGPLSQPFEGRMCGPGRTGQAGRDETKRNN